jgi:UDP-N-acetyl-2-amino-2-deoxyglucuronate dehydrogenase
MKNISHPYIETEDTGVITSFFRSGALGCLQYTTTLYEKNMEGSMTIIGTKGTVKIGGLYLNRTDYWNVESIPQPEECDEPALLPGSSGTYESSKSNHDKVIENVVRVLNDEEEITTNSVQGRQSTELMQAAYISANQEKVVNIPLDGLNYKFRQNARAPNNHKL